ncbi:sialidase family protein [Rhizobium oryzicola]|uniref:Sialidase family protein n=1 Tax=Rhizobium oryzicola TaxID=1232668 RepID=A0ABT8SW71_9HYPH|nr:sialidase family protein [Rhizobium oryzicola]MDO1582672.1 sialidase family protein [Rhizobium oryzicola]
MEHVEIYRREGEYPAWPANYGLWAWGREIVAVFSLGFRGAQEGLHARDMNRPFIGKQARSLDGGRTWTDEPFKGVIPGGTSLSGDEHVVPALQCQPNIVPARDLPPLDEPIDFTDPETVVMCARTGLVEGAISWFYVSRDRARSWSGPFRLGDFGQKGVSARTDIVPLSQHEALFFLTAVKSNGQEGRVFCARTVDGGRTFTMHSFIGEEPEGYAIMPASLHLSNGDILSMVRCAGRVNGERRAWIEQYRSSDGGLSWQYEGHSVSNTGYGGNPPTLNGLPDGRLLLVYGYRDAPFGIRARVGDSLGHGWGDEIILRDDGGMSDLGYPRTVVLEDGSALTVYYFNYGPDTDRTISGTLFRP